MKKQGLDKKPSMVIHCASGINNIGDEAILSVLIDRYAEEYEIFVISLNKKNTEKYQNNVKCIQNGHLDCKTAIKNCDVFVLGGGGLLQDETTIFNVFRWLKYIRYAIKHNKYTVVYANSVGPLNCYVSRKEVQRVLKKVDLILLRDYRSYNVLKKLGIRDMHVTADPVFSYNKSEEDNIDKNMPNRYAVFAIRHWFDIVPFIPVSICKRFNISTMSNRRKYQEYIKSLSKMVAYCNDKLELSVVFVPFLEGRDTKVAMDILEKCDKNRNYVIENKIYPNNITSLFSGAEFALCMRLHSIIFSIVSNIPFIAIAYSQKVYGIIEDLELNEVCMDVNELSIDIFKDKLRTMRKKEYVMKNNDLKNKMKDIEEMNDKLYRKYIYKIDRRK